MMKKETVIRNCSGFTLIELMLTFLISALIVAAIYATYRAQQRVATAQEAVVEMQQNLRAAIIVMSVDLRMAGFRGNGTSSAGFQNAESDAMAFSVDLNEDGDVTDPGENIGYDLYTSPSGVSTLGRASANTALTVTENPVGHYEVTGHQPVAENIEKLEFAYLDAGGSVIADPPSDLDKIRTVQIYLLAKAGRSDSKFTNNRTYPTPPSGASWAVNDNYRRRFLTTSIVCRNMGL